MALPGSCAGCSGADTWVRPMPVPGCSGAARRGAGVTLCKRGKMRPFSESSSAAFGAGKAPVRCPECLHRRADRLPSPSGPPAGALPRKRLACSATGGASPLSHIFFCLGKRQGELPEGQERGPWGQTCRARYKRKPPFARLLVRPVKMGLVSSSCAKRRALPVRSRRIYVAYAESLVQIGLLCATAPLPLSGQKKNVYTPAGKTLATNAQPSGSGARGTTGPLCTLRFAPNVTTAA